MHKISTQVDNPIIYFSKKNWTSSSTCSENFRLLKSCLSTTNSFLGHSFIFTRRNIDELIQHVIQTWISIFIFMYIAKLCSICALYIRKINENYMNYIIKFNLAGWNYLFWIFHYAYYITSCKIRARAKKKQARRLSCR